MDSTARNSHVTTTTTSSPACKMEGQPYELVFPPPPQENGFVQVFRENTEILQYEGHLKNSLYHGFGRLFDLNGFVHYEGSFNLGLRQGYGREFSSHGGVVYEGTWLKGKRHGSNNRVFNGLGNFLVYGDYQENCLVAQHSNEGKVVMTTQASGAVVAAAPLTHSLPSTVNPSQPHSNEGRVAATTQASGAVVATAPLKLSLSSTVNPSQPPPKVTPSKPKMKKASSKPQVVVKKKTSEPTVENQVVKRPRMDKDDVFTSSGWWGLW